MVRLRLSLYKDSFFSFYKYSRPLLNYTKWAFSIFLQNWVVIVSTYTLVGCKKPTFCGQKPTFESESGQAQTLGMTTFQVKKPTYPLLFLFNCDKKYKNIERVGKIKWVSGQSLQNVVFLQN